MEETALSITRALGKSVYLGYLTEGGEIGTGGVQWRLLVSWDNISLVFLSLPSSTLFQKRFSSREQMLMPCIQWRK